MKVIYYWVNRWKDGVLYPEVKFENTSLEFKGLITSFLNDDEGLGLKFLSNWIDEGLREVKKIHAGELDFYDMWGQAWGAEITRDSVLIYWGYDDTVYEETMDFQCFYKMLSEWSEFIKTQPSLENIVEFDC